MSERSWLTPKLLFGIMLSAAGVLLALDNLDIIHASEYLAWWPVGIVFFGLMKALGIGTYRAQTAGLLIAGVGTLLLLGSLDVLDFRIWDLWPIAMIAIGISLVVRTVTRSRTVRPPGSPRMIGSDPGPQDDPGDKTSAFAFMGGVTRRIVSENFQGADLAAVMGGVEIDLRSAKIAPGQKASIETFVMWGGVDLKIPENWKVSSEAAVMLGAFEDKTRRFDGPPAGELVVHGLVLMGGIEVKN